MALLRIGIIAVGARVTPGEHSPRALLSAIGCAIPVYAYWKHEHTAVLRIESSNLTSRNYDYILSSMYRVVNAGKFQIHVKCTTECYLSYI